jgi:hypothetical protein
VAQGRTPGRRPQRLAISAGLALLLATGSALAQAARPPAAAAGRAQTLRCFVLAAGAANSVQQQNGPADQVGVFNTVAMFHLGRLVGAGTPPTAAEVEAELRAEQARPVEGRPAVMRACADALQRTLGALGGPAR